LAARYDACVETCEGDRPEPAACSGELIDLLGVTQVDLMRMNRNIQILEMLGRRLETCAVDIRDDDGVNAGTDLPCQREADAARSSCDEGDGFLIRAQGLDPSCRPRQPGKRSRKTWIPHPERISVGSHWIFEPATVLSAGCGQANGVGGRRVAHGTVTLGPNLGPQQTRSYLRRDSDCRSPGYGPRRLRSRGTPRRPPPLTDRNVADAFDRHLDRLSTERSCDPITDDRS
jgi:hypothetical protein